MSVKPDLSRGSGGLINPGFIPASVRDELLLHLNRSPLTAGQKSALLTYANDIGCAMMDEELETGKRQRTQIEAIENNARRLLASLAGLDVVVK